MSTTIPLQPAFQPFRFQDLPGEIRNKIYHIFLCSVEPLPPANRDNIVIEATEYAILQTHIHPQILCTCQKIYNEGVYLMRKTNLFIKVSIADPWSIMSRLLISKRIPILPLSPALCSTFKEFVMEHKMETDPGNVPIQPTTRTFAILRRELP